MALLKIENTTLSLHPSKPTLKQINFVVNRGDIIILLGSNGSGKSTFLKLLYRHYQPDTGSIHFLNHPLSHYSHKKLNQHINVLTQHCGDSLFSSLTLYENYLLTKIKSSWIINHHDEKQFLASFLMDFNPKLADKLDVAILQLSGGEKQAFALALCFLNPPDLLLLDEHTSALDPKASAQIMQLTHDMIKKHNMTCILTTHDLDIAIKYGNRILILHEGQIHSTFDEDEKAALSKEKLVNYYF